MDERKDKCIQHHTHQKHPLKEVHKNSEFKCKCCKTEGRGTRYRCDPCNFDIHSVCATCPASLSSYTHPQHTLQLMEKPLLLHKCDLCKNSIKGMVYRCKACKFFLHPICSQLPEVLSNHNIHPPHPLKLKSMSSRKCDVCDKSCKHWRYFCEVCNVHVHVGCLAGKVTSDDAEGGGFGKFLVELVLTLALAAIGVPYT